MYASDPPMTEREVVLRERAAAAKAIEWVCARARRDYGINSGIDGLDARRYVEETFPLPKVIRARVVTDPHAPDYDHKWKCEGGQIFWSAAWTTGPRWEPLAAMKDITDTTCGFPTPERIKMWADLLARPTEQVEE